MTDGQEYDSLEVLLAEWKPCPCSQCQVEVQLGIHRGDCFGMAADSTAGRSGYGTLAAQRIAQVRQLPGPIWRGAVGRIAPGLGAVPAAGGTGPGADR